MSVDGVPGRVRGGAFDVADAQVKIASVMDL